MTGMTQPDNPAAGRPLNGARSDALTMRIADLLDNVTVTADVTPPGGDDTGPLERRAGSAAASPPPTQPAAPQEMPSDPTTSPPPSWAKNGVLAPPVEQPVRLPAPPADGPPSVLPKPEALTPPVAPAPDAPATEFTGPQPIAQPHRDAAPLPVNIKGRGDGVSIEIGKGAWADIVTALAERLDQSAGFFRNARVAMDVGPRPIVEDELRQAVDILGRHNMVVGALRTSAERTFQAALALGITATLESTEGAAVAAATPAFTNDQDGAYFVYRGYLRSGHRLRRKENILVIGDVNPGAEVASDGDVLVWGRLRGVVHAGAGGDQQALVAALDLEPTQLRIADVIAISPDPSPGSTGKWFWRKSQNKRPEVARLSDRTVVVEEWDGGRPGGIASLRRGG